MEQTESKHDWRTQVASLFGPLLGSVSIIIVVTTNSRPSVQIIALTVAILVAICSLYAVLGRPFVLAVSKTCKATREHFLAPKYLKRLEDFVERLQQFSDRYRAANVACILCKFPPLWDEPFQDPPGLSHITDLLRTLRTMLSGSRRSRKTLVFSLRWFDLIVYMYNDMCVCKPAKKVAIRVEQGLEQEKRREYERQKLEYHKVRSDYLVFLSDYKRVARELNGVFHERIARDWFDTPDELPGIDSINTPANYHNGA